MTSLLIFAANDQFLIKSIVRFVLHCICATVSQCKTPGPNWCSLIWIVKHIARKCLLLI